MNTFSDETLMAFADDELDPAARAAVDAALRSDPEIQQRVARHRALRTRIRLAYSAELDEAPPAPLLAAARGGAGASDAEPVARVSNLADARAAKAARTLRQPRQPVKWWPVASMAAGVLMGLGIGYSMLRQGNPIQLKSGGLVAGGALAEALSNHLGSERATRAAALVGLSFVAKSGDYCRVFTLDGPGGSSGVACHRSNEWRIQLLSRQPDGAVTAEGTFRTAGSELPPAILNAVQQQIIGEPLDAPAEARARERGWQPLGH